MADILHMVSIKAPPHKVYAALTERSGLAGWWTEDVKAEATVGSVARFRFGEQGPDMEITALEPDRLVAWKCLANSFGEDWVGTELSFALQSDGEKTVVRFSHRRWRQECDFLRYCSLKWATFLLSLKSLVERGAGTPWPHDIEI